MADTEPKEETEEYSLPKHSWGSTPTPAEHAVLEALEMQRRADHQKFLDSLPD